MDRNYNKDSLAGFSTSVIKMDAYQSFMKNQEFKKAFKNLSSQVLPILKSNSTSLCIVADDPDLAVVLIAEYMLTINSTLTQEKVLQILKERRP